MSVSGVDHKATGNMMISTPIYSGGGPSSLPEGGDFTWTDGLPNLSASTPTGVYMNYPGRAAFIKWTVAATTTPRTLRLYIGASTFGTFTDHLTKVTATLDDHSAADATMNLDINTLPVDVKFQAASAATTVTVKWEFAATVSEGTMALYAATLFDSP
jgi:hypothetical protein